MPADTPRFTCPPQTWQPIFSEVERATGKFPTWPTDPLHAVAVVGEEFGELMKSVLEHTYEPEKSSLADVRDEAIETAAMAIRFVMSLDAYRYARCEQHSQQAPPSAQPVAEEAHNARTLRVALARYVLARTESGKLFCRECSARGLPIQHEPTCVLYEPEGAK